MTLIIRLGPALINQFIYKIYVTKFIIRFLIAFFRNEIETNFLFENSNKRRFQYHEKSLKLLQHKLNSRNFKHIPHKKLVKMRRTFSESKRRRCCDRSLDRAKESDDYCLAIINPWIALGTVGVRADIDLRQIFHIYSKISASLNLSFRFSQSLITLLPSRLSKYSKAFFFIFLSSALFVHTFYDVTRSGIRNERKMRSSNMKKKLRKFS